MSTHGQVLVFGKSIFYCGLVHCHCLLFKTIFIVCFLESLLLYASMRLLFPMGLTHRLFSKICHSLANILNATLLFIYCYWYLESGKQFLLIVINSLCHLWIEVLWAKLLQLRNSESLCYYSYTFLSRTMDKFFKV